MERDFLREKTFSKQTILANILEKHGLDGEKANDDILSLANEERKRSIAPTFAVGSSFGVLFSLYNISRFGQLSGSGKSAAVFGVAFFSLMTYAAIERSILIKERVAVAAAEPTESK